MQKRGHARQTKLYCPLSQNIKKEDYYLCNLWEKRHQNCNGIVQSEKNP